MLHDRNEIGLALLRLAIAAMSFMVSSAMYAADLYILRFDAQSRVDGCLSVNWHDRAIFFNGGNAPATVRVIGASEGGPPPGSMNSFVVPVGEAVELSDAIAGFDFFNWKLGPLYVMHLDVPPGVRVSSRNEVYELNGCINGAPRAGAAGEVSMPVFTSLTASDVQQVHLGTDLGQGPSRTNVGIYNAGIAPAHAHIELRRVCDNGVVDQRTVTIPPNATVQTGFPSGGLNVCSGSSRSEWLRYTVVSVDQPSLTFVSNVRETAPNPLMGFVPTVDLAMAAPGIQY